MTEEAPLAGRDVRDGSGTLAYAIAPPDGHLVLTVREAFVTTTSSGPGIGVAGFSR